MMMTTAPAASTPAPTAAPTEAPAEEPEEEPMPEEEEPSLAGTVVNILGPETGPEAEGFLAGFEPVRGPHRHRGAVLRHPGRHH